MACIHTDLAVKGCRLTHSYEKTVASPPSERIHGAASSHMGFALTTDIHIAHFHGFAVCVQGQVHGCSILHTRACAYARIIRNRNDGDLETRKQFSKLRISRLVIEGLRQLVSSMIMMYKSCMDRIRMAKEGPEKRIRPITDRVFNYFSGHNGRDELTSQELYTAVLLVYNDINKHFPGPHYDPPTREEVYEMLKTFDTNENEVLDREEFEAFIRKFTSKVAKGVGKNILIFVIAAPALAFATKRATEDLPRVGKFVRQIPNGIYASAVTALVLLIERVNQKRIA